MPTATPHTPTTPLSASTCRTRPRAAQRPATQRSRQSSGSPLSLGPQIGTCCKSRIGIDSWRRLHSATSKWPAGPGRIMSMAGEKQGSQVEEGWAQGWVVVCRSVVEEADADVAELPLDAFRFKSYSACFRIRISTKKDSYMERIAILNK